MSAGDEVQSDYEQLRAKLLNFVEWACTGMDLEDTDGTERCVAREIAKLYSHILMGNPPLRDLLNCSLRALGVEYTNAVIAKLDQWYANRATHSAGWRPAGGLVGTVRALHVWFDKALNQ